MEPGSSEVRTNVAEVISVASSGPAVMVASGGPSTVQGWLAGVGSVLPAASTARTSRTWSPSVTALSAYGLEQVAHEPSSRRHSKPAPRSADENVNAAVVAVVTAAGPLSIAVSGAVSGAPSVTDQVCSAGVASVNPSAVPRTVRVCAPSARPVRTSGEAQVLHGPRSSRHSKVVSVTLPVNSKVAVGPTDSTGGVTVSVVSGAAR